MHVACPPGLFASGGGIVGEGGFADAQQVNGSRPDPNNDAPTGWTGFANTHAGGPNTTLTVYVFCVNATNTGFTAADVSDAPGGGK